MKIRKQRVKDRLAEMKKTQIWLAGQLGVSRQSLNQTIKGNPSTSSIKKIASILGLNPIDLVEPGKGYEHYYKDKEWQGIRKIS